MNQDFPLAYIENREIWGCPFRFLITSHRGEHWYSRKSQAEQACCAESDVGNHYNFDLRDMIDSGARILDVGCNEGFISCAMAAKAGPLGCVHAFDISEPNCVIADANARLNNFPIIVHHLAMAATGGEKVRCRSERVYDCGENEVATTCLDDWITFNPTVIKIDVEGYEVAVLRGGRRLLQACRPKMEIETHAMRPHGVDMRDYGFEPAELLAILMEANYAVKMHGREISPDDRLPDGGYYLHCYPR